MRISYGKSKDSTIVNVKFDERIIVSMTDLAERDKLLDQLIKQIETATDAGDCLREAKETVGLISKRLQERKDDEAKDLKKNGKALLDSIKTLDELINQKDVQGIRNDNTKLGNLLSTAYSAVQSSWDAPGQRELITMQQAERSLNIILKRINTFFDTNWKNYKDAVEKAAVSFFDN